MKFLEKRTNPRGLIFLKKFLSSIVIDFPDIDKIIPKLKYLKKLGYDIAVNLMQIDRIKKSELINVLKDLKKTKSIDVFYFADSFGNLNQKQVNQFY